LILEVLHEAALDLQSAFTEAMLRERRTRPSSQRGRIGLRVRTATTSAPGMFQIEWYRVQGKHRTQYIRRGKDKQGCFRMQYSLVSFGRITDWETDLIQHYEPQCSRLRVILYQIGQLRRALQSLVAGSRDLLTMPDSEGSADTTGIGCLEHAQARS